MKPRLNQRIDYEYGPTSDRCEVQTHVERKPLCDLWKHYGVLQE